ncbi:sodium/calcium exchanger NCL2-like [Dendronephthya gigantea]|uniref:sodium/calcium exchanger NCL2-like n=1 Tax=Dendronephthya gigantea TaxID=151771 RepID=UPI00106A3A0B|nr:sodium/calcium exchanger NCL2-like [Dendronephthya gigantea]
MGNFLNTVILLAICVCSIVEAENYGDSISNANHTDKCFKHRLSNFPCSSTIMGNLLLIVFYGVILIVAAKLISDGAELLLDLGLHAGIIGGIVLPLLGVVPDAAIIVVSGLKPDAQYQISVGMGTLAGSTIMLLTLSWGGSLFIGRCDLDSNGEAIEGTGKGINCLKQGVTLLPSVQKSSNIMLITSLLYLVVQSADWHWGPKKYPPHDPPQPKYVKDSALATVILCAISFVAYLAFLVSGNFTHVRKCYGTATDKERSKVVVALKCFFMLCGGVAMVTIFSDPMCDVLSGITNKANGDNGGSYINISPFYVSFVVTPICSNASELVSSLLFAAKKKKENVSITYAQLYGAATMNNTMCLGIFCVLVYIKNLEWYYSAEVTVILLVQWLVFVMGFPLTYKLWKVVPVAFLYVFSIILIAILESTAVGWK